jgi:enoyl reductase-like protein
MNGVADSLLGIFRRVRKLALQYFYVSIYWIVKFFKIRLQKWKQSGAQRKMESIFSGLGAEIYSLSKQGETNWRDMPSVQQQLKLVEEAEAGVFHFDGLIEEIKKDFQSKVDELKEKYAAKSAE